MADLNQYLGNAQSANDIGHSGGFASAAGGGGAGGLSMEQRRKLLNQPRVIGSYQYSRLGRQGSSVKARTADQKTSRVYDASSGSFNDKAGFSNRQNGAIADSKQIDTKSVERREKFIEPPTRNYDKYG